MQMAHCLKVYNAISESQSASNLAKWAEENPDLAYIDATVRQMVKHG